MRCFLICILMLFLSSECFAQSNLDNKKTELPSNQKNLSDADLLERYNTLCKKLNLIDDEVISAQKKARIIPRGYDDGFDCNTVIISSNVEVTFEVQKGTILMIYNRALYRNLYESKSKLEDPYNKGISKKNSEEIIQAANNYLKILYENQNLTYILTDVVFHSKGMSRGIWELEFWRYHNGYKFAGDSISIEIADQSAVLLSFVNACLSEIPPTDVKIDRSKVWKLSNDFAQKIISSEEFSQYFKNLRLSYDTKTELMIVNPNYLLTGKSIRDVTARTRKSRLAWVTRYKLFEIKHQSEKEGFVPEEISVWIDAQNGEILGGAY